MAALIEIIKIPSAGIDFKAVVSRSGTGGIHYFSELNQGGSRS